MNDVLNKRLLTRQVEVETHKQRCSEVRRGGRRRRQKSNENSTLAQPLNVLRASLPFSPSLLSHSLAHTLTN
jgi:hypothetical protein